MLFRRAALQEWRQKLGTKATYKNLIEVFEQAGYKAYAEFVKDLVKNMQMDTGDSSRNANSQTPPPPSEQPSPVSPPDSEQFSEYAAAGEVRLLHEDNRLGKY